MAITFVHTADWQLGKPFASRSERIRAHLRDERFKAVERIGVLATERRAAAVLVAGDVFDTATPADETIRWALVRMESFAGPWVLLPGNHDPALAEGAWDRFLRRAQGCKVNVAVALEPQPILLAGGALAVLPAPLRRKRESADLTEWFDHAPTPATALRIGLAHGSIPSRLPSDAEASNPIAEDRAARARLDYLALGDWHGTLRIDPRTWYAGTPEPDRAKDNDAGNALVVRLPRPGAEPEVERVPTGHYRWHDLTAAVHAKDDVEALAGRLRGLGAPLDRHIVDLAVEGAVDLACRAHLDEAVGDLRARLGELRVDDERLVAAPTDEDLRRISQGGLIAAAAERLRAQAQAADAELAATARLALQMLYLEVTQPPAGG